MFFKRLITFQDDAAIQDVALNGVDTTARFQTVWQVKVLPLSSVTLTDAEQEALLQKLTEYSALLQALNAATDPAVKAEILEKLKLIRLDTGLSVTCDDDFTEWDTLVADPTGALEATTDPAGTVTDPCDVPPGGGYNRGENQYYIVQVHSVPANGSRNGATFKYSRDNGSIVALIQAFGSATSGTHTGNTFDVDFVRRDDTLGIDNNNWVEYSDDNLELKGQSGILIQVLNADSNLNRITLTGNITIDLDAHPKLRKWDGVNIAMNTTNVSVALENGIRVKFSNGTYRPGDYWQFSARSVNGKIDFPAGAQSAFGVQHHYARLGIIILHTEKAWPLLDCRDLFPPLTELPEGGAGCCQVTVGDEVRSHGAFDDIQAAIDSLKDGGKVCLLPGEYHLSQPVVIKNKDVTLCGCDLQAMVETPTGEPAFWVQQTSGVRLQGLNIKALSANGAILVTTSNDIEITGCQIDGELSRAHIIAQGNRLTIADNTLARGGIHLLMGTRNSLVKDNRLMRGSGAGITLGGMIDIPGSGYFTQVFRFVNIEGNSIIAMDGSGISTVMAAAQMKTSGEIESLVIARNQIMGCAGKPPQSFYYPFAVGGIVLTSAINTTIEQNEIMYNGQYLNKEYGTSATPACGIFTHFCMGLNIQNNKVLYNGASSQEGQAQFCVDYSKFDKGERTAPFEEDDLIHHFMFPSGGEASVVLFDSRNDTFGLVLEDMNTLALELRKPVSSLQVTFSSVGGVKFEGFDSQGNQVGVVNENLTDSQESILQITGQDIVKAQLTFEKMQAVITSICYGEALSGFQAGIVGLGVSNASLIPAPGAGSQTEIPAAIIHDNVVSCPQGPSLMLIGSGVMSVKDNHLATNGLIKQSSIPLGGRSQHLLERPVSVLLYNLPSSGKTRPVYTSGASEYINTHYVYTKAGAETNPVPVTTDAGTAKLPLIMQRVTPGMLFEQVRVLGSIAFEGNQVETVAENLKDQRLTFAILIFSRDDASFQNNTVNTLVGNGLLASDVIVYGLNSTRLTGNRVVEFRGTTVFSINSFGSKNMTVLNQAMHCIRARGTDVIAMPNQIQESANCEKFSQ